LDRLSAISFCSAFGADIPKNLAQAKVDQKWGLELF